MAERFPRNVDPIAVALSLALQEIAQRRAEDRAAQRAKMTVVEGKRGGRAA